MVGGVGEEGKGHTAKGRCITGCKLRTMYDWQFYCELGDTRWEHVVLDNDADDLELAAHDGP